MSPTPTASEAPRRRHWSRWAPRWLVIAHRYLGVAVGLLMLMWCLTGVTMLFVHYPEVTETQRLAWLKPVDWSRCCTFGEAVQGPVMVSGAQVEDLAGAPVMRLRLVSGERTLIDLASGREIHHIDDATARAVAAETCGGCRVAAAASIASDQWTVTGAFTKDRPLWRVRLADGRGTDVYVSGRSGEVVQRTTAVGRALNWIGAVPHWLYPAILRQDTKLWTQVVVWTSLAGVFLTVTGLYLGLVAWRPFGDKRLSPYRGLMTWHHLASLAAGVLTLTWIASGLFSMNPWGFLESREGPAVERLAGEAPTFSDVQAAIRAAAAARPVAAQVRTAPFDGRLHLMVGDRRLDAQGRPAPLSPADLAAAGAKLGPAARQEMIAEGDAYYFTHHETAVLPAWRVVLTDGTRFYLDPHSGELLASFDAPARGFRWLHLGLHRLDFVPGFDRGAGWATAMVLLLAGVTLGVAVGVWLAWRRMMSDLGALRR